MEKATGAACSWQLTGSMPSPVEPMLSHEVVKGRNKLLHRKHP
jgi:hypothetical protein